MGVGVYGNVNASATDGQGRADYVGKRVGAVYNTTVIEYSTSFVAETRSQQKHE